MEPNFHNGERLFINKFIYDFRNIQRYDVVVLTPPNHSKTKYIKRVIGLPGETISIKNNNIYINNKLLEKDKNIINEKMKLSQVYFPPTKIPNNHIFVLGDNRNNSMDSTEFGTIKINSVAGKVFWIYWPLNNIRFIN